MHVIEGKPSSDLQDATVASRHRDIKVYLSARGVLFHEVTEADTQAMVLQANLDRLKRAGHIKRFSRDVDATRALIARERPTTFGALIDLIGEPAAAHAVAHGLLCFDIHQALDRSTVLVDQPNEAIDAALFLFSRPPDPAL